MERGFLNKLFFSVYFLYRVFGQIEEEDDDDTIEPIELNEVFENQSPESLTLPHHERCASHTLNLIMTKDAEKAEKDITYKRIYSSTLSKCKMLWQKYNHSSVMSDMIFAELGGGLVVPCPTRYYFYTII